MSDRRRAARWPLCLAGLLWSGLALGSGGGALGGRRLEPILVPPVAIGPSTTAALAGLPALSDELARSLIAVLREANLDARPAPPNGSKSEVADTLSTHLEAAGGPRLRLTAAWRGASASAVGDLEHLDDLVYAVFEQLRPRLLAEAATYAPVPPLAAPGPEKTPTTPAPAATPSPPTHKSPSSHPVPRPPPARPSSPPAPVTPPPVTPTPVGPPTPTPITDPPAPTLPPLQPPPLAETVPPQRVARPRVAVHIVGDPFGPLPAAFYGPGFGSLAQQLLVQYLQSRLRVAPVPSRMVGLVSGLEALTQSLRLGAHYTLMARFDTLADAFGSYGARTLTGRLHLVLLLDSRPLLDRSVILPPTPYYPTEMPQAVLGRALNAALDGVAGELSARLYTPTSP